MAYKTKQSEIVLEYLKENSDSHLTANEIATALAGKNVVRPPFTAILKSSAVIISSENIFLKKGTAPAISI